jgi:hypothetical protein
MPSKSSPTNSSSKRGTTSLKMPTTNSGTIDKRYSTPQFVNKDGSRDRRTTPTRLRT